MNELLKKDITIKILSVLFALFFWFYANPIDVRHLTVPLKIDGESALQQKGIVIKNKDYLRSVVVTIRGREGNINNVNENDFVVRLDLSKLNDAGNTSLTIDSPLYVGKEDIKIDDIKPRAISFELEKIGNTPFRVEIEPVGILKENYSIVKKASAPETIQIQGYDSIIKSIGSVKAFVDTNGLDRNLIKKVECKVYDKNGEEIAELSKKYSVDINVEVAKEVSVAAPVKGRPAKDYIEGLQTLSPEKVLITGAPEVLAGIDELTTDPIDIEGTTANVNISRGIKLPQGVKLVNSPLEVVVGVIIEHLATRELQVNKADIGIINTEIDNSLNYEIQTESMAITIKGSSGELEGLDVYELNPLVDVKGLGEGLHSVPLKIGLPNAVKLVEEYMVEINVTKR